MKKFIIILASLFVFNAYSTDYSMQEIPADTKITLKQRIMFFSFNPYVNVGISQSNACFLQLKQAEYMPLVMRAGRNFVTSAEVSNDKNKILLNDEDLAAVFCTGDNELSLSEFKEITKNYLDL